MKKILFSILLIGLLIGCSTTDQLAMRPIYSIVSHQHEDIRGSSNMDSLIVHRRTTMTFNEIVTLDKLTRNNDVNFALTVRYTGPDWRFMDEILLRIDETLITLKDSSPSRSVNRGSHVSVSERVLCVLDENLIGQLRNASSIVIQFFREPVQIPLEGINAIKAFLE